MKKQQPEGLKTSEERTEIDRRDGHRSDCATHNEPAERNGECDCGTGQVQEGSR